VATAKQIAANRANAKRSTGPKTIAGKRKSSQNALRHGLSLSLQHEDPRVRELLRMISGVAPTSHNLAALAAAQADLNRIRTVQNELLSQNNALSDPQILKQLLSTERYERRALTRRHRASSSG
jgi:hypothetical protein